MMDLTPIAQVILVYAVLSIGVLATLLTGFAQFRELPRAWANGTNAALVRRGFLAASVGMGSIGGSVLALELGGPGAIGWMWVASILGMGLIYAEVMVSVRFRRKLDGQARAGTVYALADGIGGTPGRLVALVFGLCFMVFALAAGSLLQTQQSGLLLSTVGGDRWLVAGFLVIAAGVGLFVPKLRNFVVALGPVGVALYVLALLLTILRSPGDTSVAFAEILSGMGGSPEQLIGGAAGGTLQLALQAGFLRGTLATEAGIGSAGFTPQADKSKDPAQSAAAAMLAPVVSGIVVPTLTALAVMTATPWAGMRIDEPGERIILEGSEVTPRELADLAGVLTEGDVEQVSEFDRQRTQALWAPLERPQSRGTAASLQAGQTLILPKDAVPPENNDDDESNDLPGLLNNHVYPLVMRANPRGMRLALGEGENAIILALSSETAGISEIVFRDRDEQRAQHVSYDLRVPVDNEVIGPEGGMQYVRLSPSNSEQNLSRLAKVRDGPFVVFDDYRFEARVVEMFQKRWGMHNAFIEVVDEDAFPRPVKLRSAVTGGGFRGPYFDTGEPRGPMAMIAREGFEAPVGARLRLEYRTPPRGIEVGRLLTSGEIIAPPWRFLADTEFAVIRNDSDPSKDRLVHVESKLVDGTLRFLNKDTHIAKFTEAEIWEGYSGPYLLPPNYVFEVEVHEGIRFPASTNYLKRIEQERTSSGGPLTERRSLVAVSPYPEPQGSRGELYDPHPAEVIAFMHGPWVSGSASERVGLAARLGGKAGVTLLLTIAVLILALTTMIAWAGYGARAADFVFGRGGGAGFSVVFLVVGLAGAVLGTMPILIVADHAMIVLVLLNGLGLILTLLRIRQAAS